MTKKKSRSSARDAWVRPSPVLSPERGKTSNADAYTGVTRMFEAAGFECAAARPRGKQRYRKELSSKPRRPSR